MSRLGSLFGLAAGLAGLVAAHALALEPPPVPGVTVTTPSLPVTTALPPVTTALPPPPPLPVTTALPPPPPLPVTTALPPPPPVTTALPPAPAPPVTVTTAPPRTTTPAPTPVTPPIVTTPTRPGAAPSPSSPSSPASGSASRSGGSTGTPTSNSSRTGTTRSAQPAVSTRTNRLRATSRRSKDRVAVRLAFTLTKTQRLFLIVRGPVPSCQVVGVIPVRGHRGVNKLTFAGRAGGRNLRPGSYLLSLSTVRQPSPNAPTTLVKVVSKRRSVPANPGAEKPTCTDAQASATGPFFRLLRREGMAGGSAEIPARDNAGNPIPPASSDQNQDVLGVATPSGGLDSGSTADSLQSLITIGVLTLIGAILLTTVALVTRFLRGTWNP
jgi:hypothetical protein